MTHLNKSAAVFAILNFFSTFSLAADLSNDFPSAFNTSFYLTESGSFASRALSSDVSLGGPSDVFERNDKDGTLSWAVKSLSCVQNKSFKCVGIYKNEKSKVLGNQMNPFNSVLNDSGFTLLKMNPNNAEQNSVVKCNSQFIQNMTRDTANLANCVEYSKANCKKWIDYINQNASEFTKVGDKVEECTDVMKSVDKININLRNTFQSEIKQSEKDITETFDGTAHPDRKIGLTTKVEFSQSKLSPHISTYKDMLERTADCSKYDSFFTKGFAGTRQKTSANLPAGKLYKGSDASGAKSKQ